MAESSTSLTYVKLGGKLAVGVKDSGHAPVINEIDWNPCPEHCPAFHTDSMIASASDAGTAVFGLLQGTEEQTRWMSLGNERFKKLYVSPTDGGETTAVKFHRFDGRILATGSVSGTVTILVYDGIISNFTVADTFQDDEQNKISSISWHSSGKYLVCSLEPVSQIIFLRVLLLEHGENGLPSFKLELLGRVRIPNCPTDTRISTLCHPTEPIMFSGAALATQITLWSLKVLDGSSKWRAKFSAECRAGVISMSINCQGDTLTTLLADGDIQQWIIDPAASPKLAAGRYFRRSHYEIQSGRVRSSSHATALDTSSWRYIASVGKDDASTCNTLSVLELKDLHRDWVVSYQQSRRPVYVKPINCLKFNTAESVERRFATGGSAGIIYFWALSRYKFNLDRQITPEGDRDEHYYYMGSSRSGVKMEQTIPQDIDRDICVVSRIEKFANKRPFDIFDGVGDFMHEIVQPPDGPIILSDDSSDDSSNATPLATPDPTPDPTPDATANATPDATSPGGPIILSDDSSDDSSNATPDPTPDAPANATPDANSPGGASPVTAGGASPVTAGTSVDHGAEENINVREQAGNARVIDKVLKAMSESEERLESFMEKTLSEIDCLKTKVTTLADMVRSDQKKNNGIIQTLCKDACTRLDMVDSEISKRIKAEADRERQRHYVPMEEYTISLNTFKGLCAPKEE